MKLRELIYSVDKTNSNRAPTHYEKFCEELEIPINWGSEIHTLFENRVEAFYVRKWLCTDTWVGTIVYFFDTAPLAVSTQLGRKCNIYFAFVDNERAQKFKDFLQTLSPKKEIPLLDLNEEVEEFYSVSFYEQLLTKEGQYGGQACTVVGAEPSYLKEKLTVKFRDNSIAEIPVSEFKIPLHIKK